MSSHINRMTANHHHFSTVLSYDDTSISENMLKSTFNAYQYNKNQLIDDLCDVLIYEVDEGILLSQILIKELNYKNAKQRKTIYKMLLYRYMRPEDINCINFIKILQNIGNAILPNIDCDTIAKIAANANLNGQLFVKGHPKFKSNREFGATFKNMKDWNKKQWGKIYVTMNNLLHPFNVKEVQTDILYNSQIIRFNASSHILCNKMKQFPTKIKYIVFGCIRQYESLLDHQYIPDSIVYLIIVFYYDFVAKWISKDVASWLTSIGMQQYQEAFMDYPIDGDVLLHDINTNDLKHELHVKCFDAKIIMKEINKLKTKNWLTYDT